jgi:hypothetical protein
MPHQILRDALAVMRSADDVYIIAISILNRLDPAVILLISITYGRRCQLAR